MKCPRCTDSALEERDRQSITVDLCPQCRGVWLDRGELEKLLAQAERAAAEEEAYWGRREAGQAPPEPPREPPQHRMPPPERYYDSDRPAYSRDQHYGHGHAYGKHRKKKHWLDTLGDIFD